MLNRFQTPLSRCNLKFGETGVDAVTNGLFEGYASTFGNIDSFGDTIMKGAFTGAIESQERLPRIFTNHGMLVGKTLEWAEDDIGLYLHAELTPGHSVASDVYASMRHKAVDGLSIGFFLEEGGFELLESGGRRITQIKEVPEISVVDFPADNDARIATVKAMADDIKDIRSLRECESFLREAGFSRSMAKAYISQCRSLYLREADDESEQKEAIERGQEWLRTLTDTRI